MKMQKAHGMTVPSRETLCLYSMALDLIRPWRSIDDGFAVLSLDENLNGWDTFLEAQGIGVRQEKSLCATGQTHFAVTQFETPEELALDVFRAWAGKTLSYLKPGGLLVVGRHAAHDLHETTTFMRRLACELKETGFARSQVVQPNLCENDNRLVSSIHATGTHLAVVAQKHATGKAFDAFTPPFLRNGMATPQKRFESAEHALHARIHHAEKHLENRISDLDAILRKRNNALENTLERHSQRLEARLKEQNVTLIEQNAEISRLDTELSDLRSKLKRATRRRGLRKLAHEIKKSLSRTPKAQMAADSPAPHRPPSLSPAHESTEIIETNTPPIPQTHPTNSEPVDPMPLSTYEVALLDRLFGKEPN